MATLSNETIEAPIPNQAASVANEEVTGPIGQRPTGYEGYSKSDYLKEAGKDSIAAAIEAGVSPEDVDDNSWAFFERLGEGVSAASSSPEAFITAAISAADNLLPLPFDAASAVLNMAGVDVEQLKVNNPEAANAGATVGIVVGLVGGPAKLASLVVKGAAKKGFKIAKGGDRAVSLQRLDKVKAELKAILNNHKGVVIKIGQKAAKELKDVEKLSVELTKRFNRNEKTELIRNFANDFIETLPGTHILRRYPDLMGTVVDTVVATGRPGTGSLVSNIKEQLIHNIVNTKANLGPVIGGMATDFGVDWAFNFVYAYDNATSEQGLSSADAAGLALAFANERAPEDVVTSIVAVLGKGHPLTAMVAPSVRAALVSADVAEGNVVDHRAGSIKDQGMPEAEGWGSEASKHATTGYSLLNKGGNVQAMRAKFYSNGGEAKGWAAESAKIAEDNKDVGKNASAILDFIPIIGDIKGAYELTQELRKDPINWVVVGALTAALVVGVVPGAGDALAAGIKAAVKNGSADIVGILRAVKDRDWDFLKSFETPSGSAGAKAVGDDVVDVVDDGSTSATQFAKEMIDEPGHSDTADWFTSQSLDDDYLKGEGYGSGDGTHLFSDDPTLDYLDKRASDTSYTDFLDDTTPIFKDINMQELNKILETKDEATRNAIQSYLKDPSATKGFKSADDELVDNVSESQTIYDLLTTDELDKVFPKNAPHDWGKGILDDYAPSTNIDDFDLPSGKTLNASALHSAYDKVEHLMSPEEFIDELITRGNKITDSKKAKFIELRKGTGKQDYIDKKAANKKAKKASSTAFNLGGIIAMNAGGLACGSKPKVARGGIFKH